MKDERAKGPQEAADELLGQLAGQMLLEDAAQELAPFLKYSPTCRDGLEEMHLALLKKHDRHLRRKKLRRRLGQTAAVLALVLLISGGVLVVSSEAVRVRVLNFFRYEDTKYTAIAAEDLKAVGFVYAPTYFPSGYSFSGTTDLQTIKELDMGNDAGEILTYQQSEISNSIRMDAETVQEHVTLAGGFDALLLTGKGTVLQWEQGGYFFMVMGDGLTAAEAIKIAESLERL